MLKSVKHIVDETWGKTKHYQVLKKKVTELNSFRSLVSQNSNSFTLNIIIMCQEPIHSLKYSHESQYIC